MAQDKKQYLGGTSEILKIVQQRNSVILNQVLSNNIPENYTCYYISQEDAKHEIEYHSEYSKYLELKTKCQQQIVKSWLRTLRLLTQKAKETMSHKDKLVQ